MLLYDKHDKNRKASVQEKLDLLDNHRSGHLSFIVSGISGRCVPVEVCKCVVCSKPSIMIEDKRFVCRKCMVVFPQNPKKYAEWRKQYARKYRNQRKRKDNIRAA